MNKRKSIIALFALFLFISCDNNVTYNDIYKANIGGKEVSFEGQLTATRYLDLKDNVSVACEYIIQNTESPLLHISVVDSTMSSLNFKYPDIKVIYSVLEDNEVVNYYHKPNGEGYFNIYKIEDNRIFADFYLELCKSNHSSETLIVKDGNIELPIQNINREWFTNSKKE